MSQSSYMTLFRKYNCKISNDVLSEIIAKCNENAQLENGKTKQIVVPEIMKVMQFSNDKECLDKQLDINAKRSEFLYINKEGTYLDKLMSWSFSSEFTCIKDEFNLNPFDLNLKYKLIDNALAYKMHIACKYLLSKKWSDDFEEILDNEWIDIIGNNNMLSYFEYSFRKDSKFLDEAKDSEDFILIKYNIKRLKNALDVYLNCYHEYDMYNNLVLVYSVS